MQPWWFLFLDLLGEKLSFPVGKEGKAPQRLCTVRGRPRPQDAELHMWSVAHSQCILTRGCLSPGATPHCRCSLGSSHLFFTPLQPEFHFCACRDELPAAPLDFGFSVESGVLCPEQFHSFLFTLLLLEHHLSQHVLLKVLCWNVCASSSRDMCQGWTPQGRWAPTLTGPVFISFLIC